MNSLVCHKNFSKRSLTKRELSALDKQTLNPSSAYAFILLGPGAPEVAELLEIGWSLDQIVGIDLTEYNVIEARKTYPKLKTYHCSAKLFLESSSARYGYIHLDYCGHIDADRVYDIKLAAKLLNPGGRLRVTFMLEDGNKVHYPSQYSKQFARPYEIVDHVADMIRPGFDDPKSFVYDSRQRNKSRMLTFWLDRKGNGRKDIQLGPNQRSFRRSEEILGS